MLNTGWIELEIYLAVLGNNIFMRAKLTNGKRHESCPTYLFSAELLNLFGLYNLFVI